MPSRAFTNKDAAFYLCVSAQEAGNYPFTLADSILYWEFVAEAIEDLRQRYPE